MPSHHHRSKTHSAGVVASTGLLLAHGAAAAFNTADNVAVYWGQNSYNQATGNLAQQSLADYCANSNIDVIPMSFLVQLTSGQGGQPVINLANAGNNCTLFPDSNLLDCPQIGKDIKTCQDKYKKTVLLSIGGATYTEGGFASEDAAVKAADLVWATFGPANSSASNITTTNSNTTLTNGTSVSSSTYSGQNRTVAAAAASTPTLDYDPQDPLWAVSLLAKLTETAFASTLKTTTTKELSAERTANPTASLSANHRNDSSTILKTEKRRQKQKKTSLSTVYETHTDYATNNRVATIVDATGTRFIPPGKVSSTSKDSSAAHSTEKAVLHTPKVRTVNYDGSHNVRRQSAPTVALRPFHDAAVDGFDLDIEATGQNFPAFANRLRELMDAEKKASKTDKNYYLTAAPQCPYPDLNNDAMLNGGVAFDALFVQFYNNYCGIQSFVPSAKAAGNSTNSTVATVAKQNNFNFETWHNWAVNGSANPDVKIYLGVPAGQTAAGSGYTPVTNLEAVIEYSRTFSSFGGVMAWDASQAYANGGFLKGIKDVLKKGAPAPAAKNDGHAKTAKKDKETTKQTQKQRTVRRVERQPWWA